MHMYEFVCGHVHRHAGAHGGQKGTLNPLELRLQAVRSHLMWVLGPKLSSSARAPNR